MFLVEVLGELIFSLLAHVRHIAAFAVRLGGKKLNSKNDRKIFIIVLDYWTLS